MLVDRESGEIYVYGPIGEDWMSEGITAELIVQALAALDGKRARVRINSPGGVADEGVSIYNALKRYSGGVDTYVDSIAASAASIIALAGENRYTAKGGKWMIHRALTLEIGNAEQMRKTADILETYDRSLIEIYSEVMEESPAEILQLMSEETWYTSEGAVAARLSTAIEGDQPNIEPAVASWYKNAPRSVAASKAKIVDKPKVPVHRIAAEIKNRQFLQFKR